MYIHIYIYIYQVTCFTEETNKRRLIINIVIIRQKTYTKAKTCLQLIQHFKHSLFPFVLSTQNMSESQAKIRRRRKSKPSEGKGGNTSGYTDDEGFGSCNEQHTTNGPESLNLSLNGNLTAPNTTVTTPLTPATPTGKYAS